MSPGGVQTPCPPGTFPSPPLDFRCAGQVPAPDENENVAVDEKGKEEPHEDGEREWKMELFIKESFEAKDELFPEKADVLEERPVDVNTEIEDQDPEGVLPAEAPEPATLGAAWEGNVATGTRKVIRQP